MIDISFVFKVVSIVSPMKEEATNLVDEINQLKEELSKTSQSDEFAKYSKFERKILKLRQELDSHNKSTSVSRVQAKAAFVTMWRTIGVILHQKFS